MRRRFGKVLSVLLVASLAFGCFTGCGNTNEGKTSTVVSEKTETKTQESAVQKETEPVVEEKDYKDVDFRVSWWGNDSRHNSTISWLETFEKEHNNLRIDVEYAGFADYFTKLSTQATGGELPDVSQMSFAYVKEYADNELLLPLDEYIGSGKLDFTNIPDSMVSAGRINGEMVAVTTGVCVATYVYNPLILEKAGVTISKTPTIEEYIDVCKKVYDTTGAMASAGDFGAFFRAMGESLYQEGQNKVGVTAETVKLFFEYLADGVEYGYFPTPNSGITSTAEALNEGKLWCAYITSNALGTNEANSGVDLEFFASPHTEKGNAACFQPTMMWVIPATCEDPDLAVELLNDYFNDSDTYDYIGLDRGVPVNSEILKRLTPTMTDAEKEMCEFHDYLMEGGHLTDAYLLEPSGAAEVNATLNGYIESILYGTLERAKFQESAESFVEKANEILDSASK